MFAIYRALSFFSAHCSEARQRGERVSRLPGEVGRAAVLGVHVGGRRAARAQVPSRHRAVRSAQQSHNGAKQKLPSKLSISRWACVLSLKTKYKKCSARIGWVTLSAGKTFRDL